MEQTKTNHDVTQIIKKNLFTYFNAIFLALSILLIIAGSFRNLTFLPIVAANIFIGIFQQLRAKKILDQLTILSASKYHVLRDGKEYMLTNEQLKTGDFLFLEGGQQIPADGEIVEGRISVNESLLTGESDELDKGSGSLLLSGSFVVSGRCKVRLTDVGEDSYINKLTNQAKEVKEHASEMIGDINLIVKIAGVVIIPLGALLMYQGIVDNQLSFSEAVTSMVGAVIGMIPEGLYLLVTIALVLSAARLAKNQVLLHDMKSTETLARVDVLCVDKTGTITTNKMNVTNVNLPVQDNENEITNRSNLLARYIATTLDNNITAKALQEYYPQADPLQTQSITSFSSKLKYSEVQTNDTTYRLGAPEFILSQQTYTKNKELLDKETGLGKRVIVFAQKEQDTFQPLLFISLENELRAGVEKTFRYFTAQEVRVMVISGDNPRTVSEIARSVDIPYAEQYIDATAVKDFSSAVDHYTVFGRVKPEQKKQIVEALQAKGLRVAMTGDGVNDILAMKEADCSIAMGAGSDAARQAAQVVLLDSDFSHMEQIISEGRRDINNLTRSATLFLYKNIFSMLLALFSILHAFSYPLQPSQISLVSMFNIGIPAFALALESNITKQHGRFIKVTLLQAMPAALTSFFSIAALMVFGKLFEIADTDISVASTFLLSFVGFMILWNLCKPLNLYRKVVLISCFIGFVLCAYFLSSLFSIAYISYPCLMLAIVFLFANESLMRNLTRFFAWLDESTEKTSHKH